MIGNLILRVLDFKARTFLHPLLELCSSAKVSWTFSVRCSKRISRSVQNHVVFHAAHPLHQLQQLKSLRQSV